VGSIPPTWRIEDVLEDRGSCKKEIKNILKEEYAKYPQKYKIGKGRRDVVVYTNEILEINKLSQVIILQFLCVPSELGPRPRSKKQ
jgi:hypothetical protein